MNNNHILRNSNKKMTSDDVIQLNKLSSKILESFIVNKKTKKRNTYKRQQSNNIQNKTLNKRH